MLSRRWKYPVSVAATLAAVAVLTVVPVPSERMAPPRCDVDLKGKVQVEFAIPEGIAPGATVPIAGSIVMREDAADLLLKADVRGPVEVSLDPIPAGPRFAGDTVPFTATATYKGTGETSIVFAAETRAWDGSVLNHDNRSLDALVRDDRSFAGVGGILPLKLRALREDAERGWITTDELAARRHALSQGVRLAEPPAVVAPGASPAMAESLNMLVGAPPKGYARVRSSSTTRMLDGSINIHGNATWTDQNGMSHPVYGANIQIWDSDFGFDEFVDTAVTDSNGDYDITVNNDDGTLQGDRDIYVRFVTLNSWIDTFPDGGDTYSSDSSTHDETPGGSTIVENFNFGMGNFSDACSIFEAATWIAAYIAFDANGSAFSQLEVEWPSGDDGSFYDGKLNIEQDDRWDWDTVHHEFGHFVMDELDIEDNPGGKHNIGDCIVDKHDDDKSEGNRLAWGEGWPTYFGTSGQLEMSMAALNVPRVGDAQYDDLEDTSVSYGMDTQDSDGRGEDNEVAVQRLLWDLYDSNNDGRDTISRSDNSIWNAIAGAAGSPHILSHYWQALRAGQSDADQILMGKIATDQQIGPKLTGPVLGALISPANNNFSWSGLVGCPDSYTADKFDLKFFNASTKATILTKAGLGTASHVLSDADITTIASQTHNILWGVEGYHTPSPSTGPYLGETFTATINTPPVADAGTDITVECTSPTTTPVQLNGTGSSDADGDTLTYAWTAPGVTFDDSTSGTPTGGFPITLTAATLKVSDGIQDDTDTVNVTVQDTTDPVIDCPDDIVVECSTIGGAEATDPQLVPFFTGVSATDVCDDDVTLTNNAPSFFPLGDTIVKFTAEDNHTNTSDCTAKVTVQDTTPPDISLSLDPQAMWPPNHTLRTINASLEVSDVCDPNPAVTLVSITSNEPDNGLGDGDTANDIQNAAYGTDDREFSLRAERWGKGSGRRYTVTYQATDASHNSAQDGDVVVVPQRSILQSNAFRGDRGGSGGTSTGSRPGTGGGVTGVGTSPTGGAIQPGSTKKQAQKSAKQSPKGKKPAKP
jgi:hypothetical protein